MIYNGKQITIRKRQNPELDIQQEIVQYLRFNKLLVFSVPNGTHIANAHTRQLNRLSGCLSGVSDLIILTKEKPYFVEIKTEKGRQGINQLEFQKEVEALGYQYFIWRNINNAMEFVKELKKKRG